MQPHGHVPIQMVSISFGGDAMTDRKIANQPVRILDCENVTKGVLVLFGDRRTFVFHPDALFELRENHAEEILDDLEERSAL
jgi:hypothetical protein